MHFLITAGGTREPIDPVRFITNASSGRMGYAIAKEAHKRKHHVTLISAPTNLRKPNGVQVIEVRTAAEMFEAVQDYFSKCSVLVMAAAVADYTPVDVSKQKLKKSGDEMILKLKPTVDILKWAGENKSDTQRIIGFALEDRNMRENAQRKLQEKNLDMIVANSPASINAKKTKIEIKTLNKDWIALDYANKRTIAAQLIELIEKI